MNLTGMKIFIIQMIIMAILINTQSSIFFNDDSDRDVQDEDPLKNISSSSQPKRFTRTTAVYWSEQVVVDENVIIPEGWTLSVSPGTRVFLKKDVGIYIEGSITVSGRADNVVSFTSFDKAYKWQGIQ